jgi:diguanylate cyclase (GGDEF)-like protein/PAS domain S-box-containing protein
MVLMADLARRQADRARQAQVVMERIRANSQRFDAITWRSLGTLRKAAPAGVVAKGVDTYRALASDLRQLRRLGVPRERIATIENPLGETYGLGIRTITVSRVSPEMSQRIARTEFSPALDRLNSSIAAAAREQGEQAHAELRRAKSALFGSLDVGFLALVVLGWWIHRMQRSSALAEQTRDVERRGEQRLRALIRHSSDVVAVLDASARVRWLAESIEPMLGYRVDELLDRPIVELVHPADVHRIGRFVQEATGEPGRVGALSARVRAADGSYRHLEAIADNRLGDPDIQGILLNLRDVSERLALEEQLRHQAFHDSLTGLANRALFEDRLTHALARQRRHGGATAVLFIDLDDFKTVNDSLGHGVGDEFLRVTSSRLQEHLRVQDTAARLGGDEFAVLLEDLDSEDEAIDIAERLRAVLEVPAATGERELRSSASIGVTCPAPGTSANDVLRNADVAMYAAKERGKGRVASFEPAMHDRVVERLELTGDLAGALERGELFLEYQPVVALETGQITGAEALIRWSHPTRGRLAPDCFIGLAESTGLIVPIGRWVLETACEQLQRWQAPGLEMSVNVSTRQLTEPAFPGQVREVIERTGIEPAQLTLEITEHLLIGDSDMVQRQLEALKALGVHIAVDDFGTGYSALSYLQTFPVDVLKIDRSFVTGIDRDPEKARLVQGIVQMGRNLHMRVVTEGIEEPAEAALLRQFQSGYGQGYLFSRPVDPASIEELLLAGTPLTTAFDLETS